MLSLHVRRHFPNRDGSIAFLAASDPVDTAVVFVHGFNGDAESTWIHFHTLIDRCSDQFPHWKGSDVFFWQYDSVRSALRVGANKLRAFLAELFPNPPESLFRAELSPMMLELGIDGDVLLRENFSGYSKLVLAGHSEGAVLIRLLIRDVATTFVNEVMEFVSRAPRYPLRRRKKKLSIGEAASKLSDLEPSRDEIKQSLLKRPDYAILRAQLCLFAPAHCGSTITGSWGALLESPGIALLSRALMRFSTSQVDLLPTSPILLALRHETESLAEDDPLLFALRASILWGEEERIVCLDRFRYDNEIMIPNQNHVSVCKPTLDYTYPLGFVAYDESTKPASV